MNNTTRKEKDPMGHAIKEYFTTGKAAKLRVFSSQFYEDEIPVPTLFRTFEQMPPQEKEAVRLCRGRVLDVGAGSGCHSVEILKRGLEVVAIDISEVSVQVMKERSIDARVCDFFDKSFDEKFDTILMAMNGIGIVGKIERLSEFFMRAKQLLASDGQILLDSSDIKYVFENEGGSLDIDLAAGYYGELDYRMQYRGIKGDSFDWLYIDFETLSMYAEQYGFVCEKCIDGEHYDYLARLTVRK
jgi:SAM-dependent methyltransferase